MILLKDALAQMEARDERGRLRTFDAVYCTFSRTRNEGGKIIEIKGGRINFDKKPYQGKKGDKPLERKFAKNQPGHFKNSTRNILLPNDQVRKLYIRMLISFNGQPVVY